RRAVAEIPPPELPFLALDQQQRRAGEHEEPLLVFLAVIEGHRLARPQDADVDPDLFEAVALALEAGVGAELLVVEPAGVARIDDEPVHGSANRTGIRPVRPF